MPINCTTISRIRSTGAMGDAILKMYEINRPMASETAAISEPALAVFTNASKGCAPPFSLIVINALPTGVSVVYVLPVNVLGRGFLVSCHIEGDACFVVTGSGVDRGATFLSAVAFVSNTTVSRE